MFEGFKEGQGHAELRFKHKDGSWVWIEARGKTYINEDGNLNGLIFSRDISVRKNAEEALKHKAHQWFTTFNAMSESVFLLDLDNNIVQCNRATLNLVGKLEEEILNRPCWEVIHGTLKPVDWCPGMTMKISEKVETSIVQTGNKWLQVTANPVFDDDKQLIGAVHVITDITKNKEAELKLQESEKQYQDAYERANFYKDLFAHDINNILQIITSSAELISIQLDDSEKFKNILNLTKTINQQVERGGKLVKNVHILSKLEEKNIIVQPINLYDTLKSSIKFIKGAYENRNLEIQVNSTEIDFVVHANLLLQDVFENILINGVKYNESSDVEILVKLTKIQIDSKNCIKMEFIDNGIGVPDERKEVIFSKGNRKLKGDKGMGLGLSLVSKILINFDGKIWVEDKVHGDYSKGSNFVIVLPINS